MHMFVNCAIGQLVVRHGYPWDDSRASSILVTLGARVMWYTAGCRRNGNQRSSPRGTHRSIDHHGFEAVAGPPASPTNMRLVSASTPTMPGLGPRERVCWTLPVRASSTLRLLLLPFTTKT